MRLVSLFALAACGVGLPPGGAEIDTFRWDSPIRPGGSIEIQGIYGSVRAEAASGDRVEVVATKRGVLDDARAVEVRVLEHMAGYTVCTVYPGHPEGCLPPRAAPAAGNNDVRVDFDVRVPRGVRLLARTVNGVVEARALASDIEAYTVNGEVKVSTTGSVRARTVNGKIMAAVRESGELSTVNGEINVMLPENANAEVTAQTSNGRFSTELPISATPPAGGGSQVPLTGDQVRGRIGGGGSHLRILTVNGSIYLKKAPPGAPLSYSGADWE
jgi:hypothetical protein